MDTIKYLLDLTIQDGVTLMLKAVSAWVDNLVPSDSISVSDKVQEYVKSKYEDYYLHEIEKWAPKRYKEDLLGDFHRRVQKIKVEKAYTRVQLAHIKIDQVELEKRVNALIDETQHLSISQGLDYFEDITLRWALTCNIKDLRIFVNSQVETNSTWNDQNFSEFLLYYLAEVTEH